MFWSFYSVSVSTVCMWLCTKHEIKQHPRKLPQIKVHRGLTSILRLKKYRNYAGLNIWTLHRWRLFSFTAASFDLLLPLLLLLLLFLLPLLLLLLHLSYTSSFHLQLHPYFPAPQPLHSNSSSFFSVILLQFPSFPWAAQATKSSLRSPAANTSCYHTSCHCNHFNYHDHTITIITVINPSGREFSNYFR